MKKSENPMLYYKDDISDLQQCKINIPCDEANIDGAKIKRGMRIQQKCLSFFPHLEVKQIILHLNIDGPSFVLLVIMRFSTGMQPE